MYGQMYNRTIFYLKILTITELIKELQFLVKSYLNFSRSCFKIYIEWLNASNGVTPVLLIFQNMILLK